MRISISTRIIFFINASPQKDLISLSVMTALLSLSSSEPGRSTTPSIDTFLATSEGLPSVKNSLLLNLLMHFLL
ncbi:MAG TPA: hypothetical protein DCE14_00165 [Kosmotogaceae bacterium]|nr:hypothetical protein [Kosmotogaceae bacterium]